MKYLRYILTLAQAGFILYLSTASFSGEPMFPHADKVFHALFYGLLALLCLWSLRASHWRDRSGLPFIAGIIAVAYGSGMELVQMRLAHRSAEFGDVIADAIGAAFFLSLAALFMRSSNRRRSSTVRGVI